MKRTCRLVSAVLVLTSLLPLGAGAQPANEERMKRDIEIAENALGTLIKHELGGDRRIFGLKIEGSYQEGYGITFHVPSGDRLAPWVMTLTEEALRGAAVTMEANGFRYRYEGDGKEGDAPAPEARAARVRARVDSDSARDVYHAQLIRAATTFVLDYGQLLSQLRPDERIVVTNRGDRDAYFFPGARRKYISVEGTMRDGEALRAGRINREEATSRLTVVNTESVEAREPDLEMLSSIFSRLYRPDLSDTYFVEGNVYYDKLKDFGAIFYMRVVSSIEKGTAQYAMPTRKLKGLTQEERDKEVIDVYPRFEKELKTHILEYGRTVKSLADDERLIFKVKLTKCDGCGIPATLELSLKGSDLNAFAAGKLNEAAALSRFTVKKGAPQ